jgi:inner membrane protein
MASAFTHSIFALAAGKLAFPERLSARVAVLGICCALLPDLDVLGFHVGIPYRHPLGHRGFFHSLLFAVLVGTAVTLLACRTVPGFSKHWWALAAYFSAMTASHGVLDAMTDGGYGIAFFSPFSNTRYFLPWRPLEVAPIGVRGFFSRWGWDVLMSELLWIWLPCVLVLVIAYLIRRQLPVSPQPGGRH